MHKLTHKGFKKTDGNERICFNQKNLTIALSIGDEESVLKKIEVAIECGKRIAKKVILWLQTAKHHLAQTLLLRIATDPL